MSGEQSSYMVHMLHVLHGLLEMVHGLYVGNIYACYMATCHMTPTQKFSNWTTGELDNKHGLEL